MNMMTRPSLPPQVTMMLMMKIMRKKKGIKKRINMMTRPSLPPQEMLEESADQMIDIDEVIREMNSEPKEPEPEAVSGASSSQFVFFGGRTSSAWLLILLLIHRLALRLGC